MIPGLNSNIKHEDHIFHIQTEDSGAKYGHVISHLFFEGTILATVKKDYKALLDTHEGEALTDEILKLMRASHRQMVRKLISGDFNEVAGIGMADAPGLRDPEGLSSTDTIPPTSQPNQEVESAARSPEPSPEPDNASTSPPDGDPDSREEDKEAYTDLHLAEVLALVDEAMDNFGADTGLPGVEDVAAYLDRLAHPAGPPPDPRTQLTRLLERD